MNKLRREILPAVVIWFGVSLIVAVFVWIVGDILSEGITSLNFNFILSAPRMAGRSGGIGPILISTCLILGTCLVVSIPVGIGAAVFLSEFTSADGIFGRLVRRSLDVLAAVPSIVFGLFGNVFFCQVLGLGFSILSGGLTLACMVLPLLIRSTEEGFRAVPQEYRLSAAALGISRSSTLFQILLPAAVPGLVVGLVLGTGRAIAETAALIFTSGYVDRMPTSLMDSGRSLSVHIYDLSMNVSGGDLSAYKSSCVLLVLLFLLNGVASLLANRYRQNRILSA